MGQAAAADSHIPYQAVFCQSQLHLPLQLPAKACLGRQQRQTAQEVVSATCVGDPD